MFTVRKTFICKWISGALKLPRYRVKLGKFYILFNYTESSIALNNRVECVYRIMLYRGKGGTQSESINPKIPPPQRDDEE